MTPQMAVGFLASVIKSGEPFTEQCEEAVSILNNTLSEIAEHAKEIDLGSAAAELNALDKEVLVRLALYKTLPDYRMDGSIAMLNLKEFEAAIEEMK